MDIDQISMAWFAKVGTQSNQLTPASKKKEPEITYGEDPPVATLPWISIPVLELPRFNMTAVAISATAQMAAVDHESLRTQTSVANALIDRRKAHQEKSIELQRKIMEQNRKTAEAEAGQSALRWLGKIAGLVGAIIGTAVAVVATGGAALPLGIVGIAVSIGGLMAVADIADGLVQELKVEVTGPNGKTMRLQISMGGAMEMLVQQMEMDPVVNRALNLSDPATRSGWVTGLTVYASMVVAVTMIFTTSVGFSAMKNTVQIASDASASVLRATTKGLDLGSQVLDAAIAISSGGVAIHAANLKAQTENSLAHKKMQDSLMELLSKVLEANHTSMSNVFENVQMTLHASSDMIASSHRAAMAATNGIRSRI